MTGQAVKAGPDKGVMVVLDFPASRGALTHLWKFGSNRKPGSYTALPAASVGFVVVSSSVVAVSALFFSKNNLAVASGLVVLVYMVDVIPLFLVLAAGTSFILYLVVEFQIGFVLCFSESRGIKMVMMILSLDLRN